LVKDLINFYETKFNLPVRRLVVTVKLITKIRGINGAYYQHLSSFGYTLLVLHFVQWVVGRESRCWKRHILYYNKGLAHWLFDFFQFYLFEFDMLRFAVSVYNPLDDNDNLSDFEVMRECAEGSVIEIDDPVDEDNNVAMGVGFPQFESMHSEFSRSFCILKRSVMGSQSETDMFELLCRAPMLNDNDSGYESLDTLTLVDCDSSCDTDGELGEESSYSMINYMDQLSIGEKDNQIGNK